ncbi:MAG: MFS transporter [Candidatus Tectomicrobia bacterium]|uniref:MFS transporter n=1 Tax=Tectimicrobiota bacterium TaxID=2528274 RepID=A0A932CPT8_UNCTE|nr:MFS transporter [Candidatus Tectomicrobia bacterium]
MERPPTAELARAPAAEKGGLFYGWYIVGAGVALNAYLSAAFFQGFQVFFLPILNEFHWTRTQVSAAISLRQVENGILSPVMGFVVDRLGGRQVIMASVIISGLGMVMLSLIDSLWTFYAAFMIISVGMSGASHSVSWASVVANWFKRKRGRAMGLAFFGPVIGTPAIYFVVKMEQGMGWRTSIFLLGLGILVVGIPLALIVRSRPEDRGQGPDGDPPAPARADGRSRPPQKEIPGMTVRQALKSGAFWTLVVLFGAQSLGISGLMAHQIPYFVSIGFDTEAAAATVSIMFVLSGIGRLTIGAIMDFVSWRLVIASMLVLQVVAFLVLVSVREFWHAVVFAGIMGIAFGSSIPARPLLVGKIFGMRSYGAIQGLLLGGTTLAGVAGPVIMGYVFDVQGTYIPALLGFTILTAAAVPLTFLTGRESGKRPAAA